MDSKSREMITKAAGKKIASAYVDREDDVFIITFDDRSTLTIYDGLLTCCESKHVSCDDELSSFVGDAFLGVDEMRVDSMELTEDADEFDVAHDVCFVAVRTGGGTITLQCHVEHNGAYGKFDVCADYEDNKQ
jgi:hypothetical protein